MVGLDLFAGCKVGNGSGNLEDAVISTGRQTQAVHGLFEQSQSLGVDLAHLAQLLGRHLGIAVDVLIVCKAFLLHFPCLDHAVTDLLTRFRSAFFGQLIDRNRCHFYVQVDPVQQRSRDLVEVFLNDARCAYAIALRVVEISTGAGLRWSFVTSSCKHKNHYGYRIQQR